MCSKSCLFIHLIRFANSSLKIYWSIGGLELGLTFCLLVCLFARLFALISDDSHSFELVIISDVKLGNGSSKLFERRFKNLLCYVIIGRLARLSLHNSQMCPMLMLNAAVTI